MGKFLICLFTFAISFNTLAKEINCNEHPIYCQIVESHPKINKFYAMKLSNIIYSVTKKYNIQSRIYTAILAQESMYNLNAKNCTSNAKFKIDSEQQFYSKMIEIEVCQDFGISQINYKTAQNFNFNLYKLTSDLHYSVEAGAIVLADFKKRYSHKENDYWTRYNTSNPKKREIYKRLVQRFIK